MNILRDFDIRNELEDFDTIHAEIEKGIVFKGTNLWILMCAIIVASVGLNMNSTAVIIGAMLISPLMGPINGIGYSIATYNRDLFERSVKNLLFAVLVSLITSFLYFLITPVNTAHSELLARTRPTIYDVFIAFFGGLAGILAISSRLKGNVIPGVAIATALMPPICTAGYGLATLQFNYFFGALYLFSINMVFIAVASLLLCQIFRFPIRSIVDPVQRKRVTRLITTILLITIIPSIFFGYRLVQQENFFENANRYVKSISVMNGSYLIDTEINQGDHSINLIYSGYGISDDDFSRVKEKALIYQLDTAKISIVRGTDVDILRQSTSRYISQTQELENRLNVSLATIQKTQFKLDSIRNIPTQGEQILKEVQQLYLLIETCSYAETVIYGDTTRMGKIPVVIFSSKRVIGKNDKNKIMAWVRKRLNNENAQIYFQ